MRFKFKIFLLLAIIFFLHSCKNEDNDSNSELISSWKLVEILLDPGDGSGFFQPVESNKTIKFYSDGTIKSNGSLCDMSITSNNPTVGTYFASDLTFRSSDCSNPEYIYNYEIEDSFLIINYPCIEPCRSKYILIE